MNPNSSYEDQDIPLLKVLMKTYHRNVFGRFVSIKKKLVKRKISRRGKLRLRRVKSKRNKKSKDTLRRARAAAVIKGRN